MKNEGLILRPGVICGLSLLFVLYSAPRGFSPGTPAFPSAQKQTFLNFQFDLDVRHFSHEPLARVIARALPVLNVKFKFILFIYFIFTLKLSLSIMLPSSQEVIFPIMSAKAHQFSVPSSEVDVVFHKVRHVHLSHLN